MKILFVHQNFPGQFIHLAPALAARGHQVLSMGDIANKRGALSGVRNYYYRSPVKDRLKGLGSTFVDMASSGEMVASACSQLRDRSGFFPDVVFGHNGWGEMLFLREVWPNARILNYAELAYRSRGLDADFDPEFQRPNLKSSIITLSRAAHILQSMIYADVALSPTVWQAASFPHDLRHKITVIHDGVNADEVRPNPNASLAIPGTDLVLRVGDEVLSFLNRNLEPYRGYHTFMRALPAVMESRPNAQVVIVGGDGQSYGRPPEKGTWKQIFLDEVADRLDLSRVHFLGKIPRADFLSLIQLTRVHAYLTYPFVLSWSMIEAMSAGALVIGSATAPVQEVIRNGVNGRLVDFFDVKGWSEAIISALANPEADNALRVAARATVLEKYDLFSRCLPRQVDFVEQAASMVLPSDR